MDMSRPAQLAQHLESWAPGAGDIIVSNWASWIEILYLAFRYVYGASSGK
jgi:hypothetical protein